MPRVTSKTSSGVRPKRGGDADPSLPYEDWLLEQLKDPEEAAGYLEAVIAEGNQAALMLALRQIAKANGGIAAVARRAKLTREAAYRILSRSGNPEAPTRLTGRDARFSVASSGNGVAAWKNSMKCGSSRVIRA